MLEIDKGSDVYIIMVEVKHRKSNSFLLLKEIAKIVVESNRSNSTCSGIERSKSKCSCIKNISAILNK
jgi:hypothetical protein